MKIRDDGSSAAQAAAERAAQEARQRAEAEAARQAAAAKAAAAREQIAQLKDNFVAANPQTPLSAQPAASAVPVATAQPANLDISKPPPGTEMTASEWKALPTDAQVSIWQAQAPQAAAASANAPAMGTAQAQADFAQVQAAQSKGQDPARLFVDDLAAHQGDPAYQAEMIRQAKGDQNLNLMGSDGPLMVPCRGGLFGRSDYDGKYNNNFTDADRAAFTSAMSAAVKAGVYTDAEIQKLAADDSRAAPFAWQELAGRIGTPGVPASPLATMATAGEIKDVQNSYDQAKAARDKADQELASQMSGFDKTLTPDQKQKYIDQYRLDHKAVYDAYDAASTKLAETLKRDSPALEAAAAGTPPDPTAADALYKGYQALATSAYAKDAMDFVVRAGTTPALGAALTGKDLIKDIFQPAAATVTGLILADPAKSKDQALADLKALYQGYADKFEGVKDLKDFGKDLKEGIEQIKSGLDDLQKLLAGKYKPEEISETVAKSVEEWNGKGPFGKMLAVAGAMYGFKAVYDAAKDGDQLKAVSAFASAISGSSDVAAMALGAWARSGKIFAKAAGDSAEFLTKFAPFIGAVASGLCATVDIRDAMSGGNAGDWINVAGDLLSFVGSVGECFPEFPPALVAGEILTGVGTIVSAAGELGSSLLTRAQTEDEQRKCLAHAGITDPKLVDALIHANNGAMNDLIDKLGFAPQDAQAFLLAHADFAQFLGAGNYGSNFIIAAQAVGVHDTASMETFLAKLSKQFGGEVEALYALTAVIRPSMMTDDDFRQWVQQSFP